MVDSGSARPPAESKPADLESLANGDRLVFIGGLHRSGTSIIHRCLSDHPDVSGFHDTGVYEDEGQHLQSVYLPASAFGGPGSFGFRAEAFLDEGSPLVSRDNANRLLTEWLPHWDPTRAMLVEKSPPNLVRTRFFQALFPHCRFVIVLRHPVAVAYATQKWTSRVPRRLVRKVPERWLPRVWVDSLIEHWLICHERFERDRAHLQNVHVLRYEDFVEQPEQRLGELYAFLGLSRAPLLRDVRRGVNDRYWTKWVGRQRSLLTRPYISRIVARYEDRVRRLGYSLLEPS